MWMFTGIQSKMFVILESTYKESQAYKPTVLEIVRGRSNTEERQTTEPEFYGSMNVGGQEHEIVKCLISSEIYNYKIKSII